MYALQGQQALRGLYLWVEHTNAQGGLFVPDLRRQVPLQLLTYDDHSRRADVEHLVERLIAVDRVDCLIGPYSSGLTRAAARIAETHCKLLWNHGGSSDVIMREGFRWSVHLLTPASRYFAGLFTCLRRQGAEAGHVAIVQRRRGTFSREVANGAREQAERSGWPLLPTFFYPEDSAQVSALVTEVAAANPGLIILVGNYDDDVAFVRALAGVPLRLTAAAAVAAPLQAFSRDLRGQVDGWIGPSQWEPEAQQTPAVGPSSAAFVDRFRQRFGQVPDYPAAQAYATGVILRHCVGLAGSYADADLRTVVDRLWCRTFYGDFRLDAESGVQVGHETVLVQWQNHRKAIIWPTGIAQAELVYPKS
jgi:branched-chain amino acid transport system substrate-binding protein